ncbi:MAG: dTMP kinase [Dehalococcoidia bacterium]|nr:dTMP kinase [Dehalococcoidia bacterium]
MELFITFEGGEGCGKSHQSKSLYRRLLAEGISAVLTHEPGGTALGENITKWLKWRKEMTLSATCELLLFNASRNQLCNDVITPAIIADKVVVCDRFYDSTIAYQGYGRGLDPDIIKVINRFAADGLVPRLTILLDMPVSLGLARKSKDRQDRFEAEKIAFHEQVRQGYLQLARNEPQRFFVVDAALSKKAIADLIWQKVASMLPKTKQPII